MLTLDGESPAHPDVQEMYIACAGVAQTHSAGAAHRISHSLDPVIDPKIPPISPRGSAQPKAQLHDEELVCRMTGFYLQSGGGGQPRNRMATRADPPRGRYIRRLLAVTARGQSNQVGLGENMAKLGAPGCQLV